VLSLGNLIGAPRCLSSFHTRSPRKLLSLLAYMARRRAWTCDHGPPSGAQVTLQSPNRCRLRVCSYSPPVYPVSR